MFPAQSTNHECDPKTWHKVSPSEVKYMSITRGISIPPSDYSSSKDTRLTPSFFEILAENDCLPKTDHCLGCLQKTPVNAPENQCEQCANQCGCYCRVLCDIQPKEKESIEKSMSFHQSLSATNA